MVMTRKRVGVLAGVAALAVIGLGAGIGVAVAGGTGSAATPAAQGTPGYSWYRSMMGRYSGGSMMGGSGSGWMMGAAGYQWMMGGASAPGWMHGGTLPGSMMGTGHDPGKVMGSLWANAPGPRVSPHEAAQFANLVPAGASIDRARRTITFTGASVHLIAVASPAGGPDETFRIAGMVDPAIMVQTGSRVSVEMINADPGTAHGLVITASSARSSWMPMMAAAPSFGGSALWFLGNPTAAGMHAGTVTFTASTAGTYHYLCPVPGHAQKGMVGTFIVRSSR
jgi:rusticyanin